MHELHTSKLHIHVYVMVLINAYLQLSNEPKEGCVIDRSDSADYDSCTCQSMYRKCHYSKKLIYDFLNLLVGIVCSA